MTALGVVMAALLYSSAVQAQDVELNLPAQSLQRSVEQLARQSQVEIIYVGNILNQKTAPQIHGKLSVEAALHKLLQGTNLSLRRSGETYLIVERDRPNPADKLQSQQTSTTAAVQGELATIVLKANDEPIDLNPARSVSVISRKQLEDRPAKHAADMLEQTAGVYSSVSQQDPALSVNIRGIQDYGRVNMNIDGMRQNFQKSGHGQRNGQMYIDSELLSGVVIEKGASSAMGGAGVLGGIATFNTVSASDFLTASKPVGGKIRASTGDNATDFIGSAVIAGRYENFDALLGISDRRLGDYYPGKKGDIGNIRVNNATNNYDNFTDYIKNHKVTDTNYKMRSYLGKLGWDIREGQRLQLSYLKTETDTPNASALKDIHDPDDYSKYYLGWKRTGFSQIDSQNIALDYSLKLSDQPLLDLKAKLYYVNTKDNSDTYPTNILGTDGYWSTLALKTYGLQLENTSRWSLSDASTLSLNYGLDIFYDQSSSDSNRAVAKGTTPEGNRLMSSAFTNMTWDYGNWLNIQTGLRYDRYRLRGTTGFEIASFPYTKENPCTEIRLSNCGGALKEYREWNINDEEGQLSPTLAVSVHPGVEWLTLFANYGQAWRPPAITETLTYGSAHSTSTQYPNPYLKPESSQSWEAGVSVIGQNLFRDGDRFFVKTAYFDTLVDNYINLHIARVKPGIFSPSIGNAAYVNNLEKSKFRGIELQLNYDADYFYVDLNYTHMIGKNDYCTPSAWMGGVTYTGGERGNYYEIPAEDWNSSINCNDGTIFNSSAFLPGDRGSLTLGGRAFDRRLDAGVIVRYNPGYQDHSVPTNFPYLADWPTYTLFDLYGNIKVNDQLTLHAAVENLTNQAYVVNFGDIQSSTLGRGRTFQAGLEYKF
ncbi:TonB-dependent receptor [Acinetobacter larvae]|uniref:TonB-dependent receptor n=2 Tax=Acinetobacter larvae TaxID=1789224 RepID=A0A1B2M400_9GAMM|nr:TonB-dependent receptor [Acinetobacter larvae]